MGTCPPLADWVLSTCPPLAGWVLGIEDFEFEIPYGIEIYGEMDRFGVCLQADGIESYGRDKKAIKGKWQVIRYWSANDRNMGLKE